MDKNKAFADAQGLEYPLLCDTNNAVAVAYGAATDASTKSQRRIAVLINGAGAIVKTWDPAGKSEFPALALKSIQA